MAAVTFFLLASQQVQMETGISSQQVIVLFAVLAIGQIWMITVLDQKMKSQDVVKRYLAGKGATAIAPKMPDVSNLDDDKTAIVLFPLYFQLCLVRWALIEVIAVFGFILGLITQDLLASSIFFAVAAFMMVQKNATMDEVNGMIRKARNR